MDFFRGKLRIRNAISPLKLGPVLELDPRKVYKIWKISGGRHKMLCEFSALAVRSDRCGALQFGQHAFDARRERAAP
jgi:hypothetical protein